MNEDKAGQGVILLILILVIILVVRTCDPTIIRKRELEAYPPPSYNRAIPPKAELTKEDYDRPARY